MGASDLQEKLKDLADEARKIATSPPPNEDLVGINYSRLREIAASIPEILEKHTRSDLIESLDAVAAEIGIPNLETNSASRGMLVATTHSLNLIRRLNSASNVARAAGYRDPSLANLDLTDTISAEFLADIKQQLLDVNKSLEVLKSEGRATQQLGVSIGIGVMSVDLGTAAHILENSTKDALEYVEAKYAVNAQNLQKKVNLVRQEAQSIFQSIKASADRFGKNLLDISRNMLRSAAAAYAATLQLIQNKFSHITPGKSGQKHEGSSVKVEDLRPQLVGVTKENSMRVHAQMDEVLREAAHSRSSFRFIANHNVKDCLVLESKGKPYLLLYFASKKYIVRLDDPDKDIKKSMTFEISDQVADLLKSAGRQLPIAAQLAQMRYLENPSADSASS